VKTLPGYWGCLDGETVLFYEESGCLATIDVNALYNGRFIHEPFRSNSQ
jgi:hypothetical protein